MQLELVRLLKLVGLFCVAVGIYYYIFYIVPRVERDQRRQTWDRRKKLWRVWFSEREEPKPPDLPPPADPSEATGPSDDSTRSA